MTPQETVLTYNVIFEPAEEGGYIAFVPSIPGCMTQGETFEEAKENVKDAIKGCLAVMRDEGVEVPKSDKEQITAFVAVPAFG
ncbi:MAG: type II toxin-antitoxin system HicB family antitoxin [Patescibacteria group bacterium]|jgi:predicted RNase H-like HicB family nuclease